MVLSHHLTVGLLLAGALWLPAAAQSMPAAADGDAVRVYTNDDLERLGPTPAPSRDEVRADDPGWEFVTEFLAREAARLDAERAWELGRRRADLEEKAEEKARSSRRSFYAPYLAYPYGRGGRRPAKRHVPSHAASSPSATRIIPLHARESLAMRQRAKALRHSGRDAVPKRGRGSR